MGCEAKTEFKIATMENQQGDFLYALEDTSCMNRFICGGNRPWEINVTQGAEAGGPLVAKYERPFRCGMGSCKCCCYQEVLSTLKIVKNREIPRKLKILDFGPDGYH